MKILQQNSTHKAVLVDNKIKIYIKGFECGKPTDVDYLKFEDEYCYSIPAENKDDLFAIFERLDEDNRCNLAEANSMFNN